MSQKASQSPRSKRNRLERIDIDELFDSPSNRGMLSFLERAPEEALARLAERRKVDSAEAARASLPRSVDTLVQNVSSPGKVTANLDLHEESPRLVRSHLPEHHESPPGIAPGRGEFPNAERHTSISRVSEPAPVGSAPPVGGLPPVYGPVPGANSPAVPSSPDPAHNPLSSETRGQLSEWPAEYEAPPVGDLPTVGDSHPNADSLSPGHGFAIANVPTEGNSPPGDSPRPSHGTSHFTRAIPTPSTPAQNGVFISSDIARPGGKLPPDVVDGTIIGRRQKIRRAVVAQDGHSGGEQLLYQTLWNAARPEPGSLDRRIIVVGYQGMSALCKLDKKNCKKNAKGLIEKLAIEVAETYRSDERIGTTYRIFSYKEILRRREEAGMVWVVRTSGVRFVHLAVEGDRLSQGVTHPVGKLPTQIEVAGIGTRGDSSTASSRNSPLHPGGDWSRASVGSSPPDTVGETPTLLKKGRNSFQGTSSAFPKHLGPKLRSVLPSFDDAAVEQLWARCSQIAPDCTDDDIEYCFRIKANQLLRGRKKIDNPVGIMIWSVPKTFEGAEPLYLRRRLEIERIRTAEEEERQRSRATLMEMLQDSRTSPDDRTTIQRLLEEM